MRWVAVLAVCLLWGGTAHADWGARRDPFDATVVARYKAILAKNPHDAAALRSLVSLYQRYRKVETLEAEYRALLAHGEDGAALVVLAQLAQSAGRSRTEAVALWQRATAARPDDWRTWLALGDATITDAKAARDAFQKAATLASAPKDHKVALTRLVGAARSAGDHATVDAAYADLIALSPNDGTLWLDRGSAQLAAHHPAAARDSFATAEALFKTDPERRLTAMVNQGTSLVALGRLDEAVAQYERTLDAIPPGYFLGAEVVSRIVDIARKQKRLPDALARLEKRWPERKRRHFEWSMLAALYQETGDDERAIAAYRRAVEIAPTEVTTQRALIALLDKRHPDEALAQHEKAARAAPGDADLQIELAKRYRPTDPAKALTILAALSKRMAGNISVKNTLAQLYEEWDQHALAITEYAAIADLEPQDPDHAIVLGEAYWRSGNLTLATQAWDRLERIGTPSASLRHGDELLLHEQWTPASAAFTRVLALDAASADAYYGRARARDALQQFPDALDDARRAVALTALASQADGLRNRNLLARVLGHWYDAGDHAALTRQLAQWRFAFDRGDASAGYLLAAHHARVRTHQYHGVLVQLYRLVPTDDSLGIALARSFMQKHEFDHAVSELQRIAARSPARADEIAKLLDQVSDERVRAERQIRWDEEGTRAQAGWPDLVGKPQKIGVRLSVGADIHATRSELLAVGLYYGRRLAPATSLLYRFDWSQRDDQREEVNAFGLSAGVSRRVFDARKFEVAAGLAGRFELRYGGDAAMSPWNTAALAADATVELMPRRIPGVLGLRYHQTLTDSDHNAALLVELGFEVR